jgi:hypothetical protein
MATKGTYINQQMKWKLKEFAVEQVTKRVVLSPLGQEYLDAITSLVPDVRQAVSMAYPVDDMLVLKKYGQHAFAGMVVLEGVTTPTKLSDLWVPLFPKKFLVDCLTNGDPIQSYHNTMERTLKGDIPRYFPDVDVAEVLKFYEAECDGNSCRKSINRYGYGWELKTSITDVSDLAEAFYGEIVSSAKTQRQRMQLFDDHRTPHLGNFNLIFLENLYWEPYHEEVASTLKVVGAVNDEIHKYICAYEVLIEKKRTIEALLEVWPEMKSWVEKSHMSLYSDGCPNLALSEAEALVRQDLSQPMA